MSIVELMEKAKKSASKRTKLERKKLLIEAKILNIHGNYYVNYFSKETVSKNRTIAKFA